MAKNNPWWFVSVADAAMPKGQQRLGVVILQAKTETDAYNAAGLIAVKTIGPKPKMHLLVMPFKKPDDGLIDRLISPDEVHKLDIGEEFVYRSHRR